MTLGSGMVSGPKHHYQGSPAVSHNTTRLYWMVFNLYECHIRSYAVTALFWIFFYIFPLFAGESSSLVKNVEVAFEIKPRHLISCGNMSVNQPFLVLCLRRSSYFSNFRWCAQSILVSKGIVNSAMITFFKLTLLLNYLIYIGYTYISYWKEYF